MDKPITIHDIARLANVSSATVSRVLSNSSYPVSAALRDKILRIAKEANYIPNQLGKQLKTRTNRTIGIIVPTITNQFYSSIILGVEELARKHEYQVLLCNSFQDPALERKYIQAIFEKQVRGLVISSISGEKELLRPYIERGLHVVAVDQRLEGERLGQVDFEYRQGGRLATRYLIGRGHRRIAYVTAPLDRPSRRSIHAGYMEAMGEAGLSPQVVEDGPGTSYSGSYEFENGKALTARLLESEPSGETPTAIFACNDMTAFGVIHALTERGIRVPDEMSVVGFDGIDFGQMITPPLTTVYQPTHEMGRLACSMLIEQLEGRGRPDQLLVLQPELLERSSVADVRE
ncbi:LacI family DNA-binding transcriptional regulator [Paenibacillus sp. HJGM_3]|uniref:LacI family DNA-binding transcriptional regulator n=1 Tax=Paenibacillus sp. HJGM_3 TaxID=3379816 RepID=UPI003859195A